MIGLFWVVYLYWVYVLNKVYSDVYEKMFSGNVYYKKVWCVVLKYNYLYKLVICVFGLLIGLLNLISLRISFNI